MWKFYDDSGCTIESSCTLQINSETNLPDNPQDYTFYLAYADVLDEDSILTMQAKSDTGVGPVQLGIVDSAVGSDREA